MAQSALHGTRTPYPGDSALESGPTFPPVPGTPQDAQLQVLDCTLTRIHPHAIFDAFPIVQSVTMLRISVIAAACHPALFSPRQQARDSPSDAGKKMVTRC